MGKMGCLTAVLLTTDMYIKCETRTIQDRGFAFLAHIVVRLVGMSNLTLICVRHHAYGLEAVLV